MKTLLSVVAGLILLAGCVVVTETPTAPPGGQGSAADPGSGASQNGYSFLHTLDGGQPVRWSTCEPIRYVVRRKNLPDGAGRLLEQSVRRISEASGLEFSREGTTDEKPTDSRKLHQPKRYGDRWAPVLIAFSGPGEYERLQGQAAGYGGAVYVQRGGATPRYVSGMAVFDTDQLSSMGGEKAMRAVMMHELAHVVGLGHVRDSSQLMNPVQYGERVTELQDGDLAGLEVLGNGECYQPLEPGSIRR
jgi:hypothetical protein